jgi:hypothetical protein
MRPLESISQDSLEDDERLFAVLEEVGNRRILRRFMRRLIGSNLVTL